VEEGGQVVNLAREGLHLPDRLMMKAIIILNLPHIERILCQNQKAKPKIVAEGE
jgi:hypothetical protein